MNRQLTPPTGTAGDPFFEDVLRRLDAHPVEDAVELRVMAANSLAVVLQQSGRDGEGVQVAQRGAERHADDVPSAAALSMANAVSIVSSAWSTVGRRRDASELIERARQRWAGTEDDVAHELAVLDVAESEVLLEIDAMGALRRAEAACAHVTPPRDEDEDEAAALASATALRAHALERLGRSEEATALARAALEDADDDDAKLAWAREWVAYSRYAVGVDMLRRVGRGADAEHALREAIAAGYFDAWLELSGALSVTGARDSGIEHALRQAIEYCTTDERRGLAAVHLAEHLQHRRGDVDAAKAILWHAADGDGRAARSAAVVLRDLERPGRWWRRLKWRMRRHRDGFRGNSPPARLIGSLIDRRGRGGARGCDAPAAMTVL